MSEHFYHPEATESSWRLLQELKRKYEFILIGGWAVWLYTRALKSKDIDIIVDFDGLASLRKDFQASKNPRLKKYEIKQGSTDVDVYVFYYTDFGVPPALLQKNVRRVEGFRVLDPEYLLILKLNAVENRGMSLKGEKDRIDILALIASKSVDLKEFRSICIENRLERHIDLLRKIVEQGRSEYASLGMSNLRRVKLFKENVLESLNETD